MMILVCFFILSIIFVFGSIGYSSGALAFPGVYDPWGDHDYSSSNN